MKSAKAREIATTLDLLGILSDLIDKDVVIVVVIVVICFYPQEAYKAVLFSITLYLDYSKSILR